MTKILYNQVELKVHINQYHSDSFTVKPSTILLTSALEPILQENSLAFRSYRCNKEMKGNFSALCHHTVD
jgi:hypothetical protein